MAFLIGQMWPFLLLVFVFAASAGWMWHLIRSQANLRNLEHERARLRGELVSLVNADDNALRAAAEDRARDVQRAREAIGEARLIELTRELADARAQRDAHAGRIAELERNVERAQAPVLPPPVVVDHEGKAALEAEVARLEAALAARKAAPVFVPDERALREMTWKARYFAARTAFLENEKREVPALKMDFTALALLEKERDEARREAAALRAAPAPQPVVSDDEATTLKWRVRYLEARNRYLEGRAEDPETARRRDWRAAYVETRLQHLMKAAAPDPAREAEEARHKWRLRYLDSRVQHLEGKLAEQTRAAAPPSAAAPIEQEPANDTPRLVPEGAEERPASLAAPRHGAPDDLTLIDGIGPKTEATLHALGIFHFDQIADWSRANIAWVDQYLRYRGRIVREQWVEQARALAKGAQASRKLYFETEAV